MGAEDSVLLHLMEGYSGTEELFLILGRLMPEIEKHQRRIWELEANEEQLSKIAQSYKGQTGWELVAANLESAADARTAHIKRHEDGLAQLYASSEVKSLVMGTVAAGILFVASHAVKIGKAFLPQGAEPKDGRIVKAGYCLKEFIRLSRNHAAHFSEMPTDPKLLKFLHDVLGYVPNPQGPFINHSYSLLCILGWSNFDRMMEDVRSLFR
jgi:hypothetical protein